MSSRLRRGDQDFTYVGANDSRLGYGDGKGQTRRGDEEHDDEEDGGSRRGGRSDGSTGGCGWSAAAVCGSVPEQRPMHSPPPHRLAARSHTSSYYPSLPRRLHPPRCSRTVSPLPSLFKTFSLMSRPPPPCSSSLTLPNVPHCSMATYSTRKTTKRDIEAEGPNPTAVFYRLARMLMCGEQWTTGGCGGRLRAGVEPAAAVAERGPEHPGVASAGGVPVNSVDYLLEVVPISAKHHPPSSSSSSSFQPLDRLAEWLPFSSKPYPSTHPQISPNLATGEGDDYHDELRDDSPEPARAVRVVTVAPGWREKFPSSGSPEARKWAKRQWDIASILLHPLPISNDHDPPTSPPPTSVLDDLGQAIGDIRHELLRAFTNPSTQ
ncbi:uncharacterized protein VP01_950g7 [Puccinia sorghi]|uniref:Uncharacterized protein n=1 Tax=Puccinia sorghi TaxID=27349 RepID=A0A0L6U6F8_9BASI|nr:uncharacterized protein VP01_950g7 [Puccinia sorghi]